MFVPCFLPLVPRVFPLVLLVSETKETSNREGTALSEGRELEIRVVGAHLDWTPKPEDPARIAEVEALRREEIRETEARALQFGSKSPCIERTES